MPHDTPNDSAAAVDRFMPSIAAAQRPLVEELRRAITAVDPSIAEGIKWNAPSWRTTEYFATTHLRAKRGVMVILHRGAKKRTGHVEIADPAGLLTWLGEDRASIAFEDLDAVRAKTPALAAVLRQWIAQA